MWLSVDPLAEEHPNFSPYVYCALNPMNIVDPDGRDWYKRDTNGNWERIKTIEGETRFYNEDGDQIYQQGFLPLSVNDDWVQAGAEVIKQGLWSDKNDNSADKMMIEGLYLETSAIESIELATVMVSCKSLLKPSFWKRLGAGFTSTYNGLLNLFKSAERLSKGERVQLFLKELATNKGKTKNPDDVIKLINKSLDKVEDLYSGVVKNPNAAKTNRDDGRMYGILDDLFVTKHSNGNVTAKTKGHIIDIQNNGTYIIKNKSNGEVIFNSQE